MTYYRSLAMTVGLLTLGALGTSSTGAETSLFSVRANLLSESAGVLSYSLTVTNRTTDAVRALRLVPRDWPRFIQLSEADLDFGALPPRGEAVREIDLHLPAAYARPDVFFSTWEIVFQTEAGSGEVLSTISMESSF